MVFPQRARDLVFVKSNVSDAPNPALQTRERNRHTQCTCRRSALSASHPIVPSARDIAAKAAGVGHDTVQKAMDIKKKDPEVYKRDKSGEITVGQAHRALKGDNSTKRKDQLKNAGKRRMGCPQKHLFLAGRYRPIPHTRNQGLGRAAATGFLTGWRSL